MHLWKQKICLYDISLDSIALPFHAVLFRTLSTKQFLGHLKKLWPKIFIWYHSSEIKNVHSTKCSSKIIQNWLYLMYRNNLVISFNFILCNFTLSNMNILVYVNMDQGIHKGKSKVGQKENQQKAAWVFLYKLYSKFWSILLEHYLECKPIALKSKTEWNI